MSRYLLHHLSSLHFSALPPANIHVPLSRGRSCLRLVPGGSRSALTQGLCAPCSLGGIRSGDLGQQGKHSAGAGRTCCHQPCRGPGRTRRNHQPSGLEKRSEKAGRKTVKEFKIPEKMKGGKRRGPDATHSRAWPCQPPWAPHTCP